MRQFVFSFLALTFILVTACNQGSRNNSESRFGQGDFNPEERVNRQIEQMNEAVELSKDQEKQVREILLESMDNMMKMRDEMRDSGEGFEGMREKMQQAREEQSKKMKEILSDEQWEKYLVYEEERRARRGQGRQR